MIPMKVLPSQSRLKEIFDYDPYTGFLTYRYKSDGDNVWNSRYAGKIAGSTTCQGYIDVGVDNQQYKAHRIIYKWFYDEEPEMVDHINGVRNDNRIKNLRASNAFWNKLNKKQKRPFIVQETNGQFTVRVTYKREEHYLGRTSSYDEAVDWINEFFAERGISAKMPVCK